MGDETLTTNTYNHSASLPPSTSTVTPLTVYTLGRFAVYRGDELLDDSAWKRRKAKTLFKLLLLAPQRQLLKDQALDWLWPDQPPERAMNNLHRTLFVLRRALQPDLSDATASPYLLFKDGLLTLNPAAVAWVDAEEFERLLQLGQQADHPLPHYQAARALYHGEFLPEDRYEEWADDPRQRLSLAYHVLLQRLARLYAQRAAYNEAIACLQELVGLDPTNEEACRQLMGLYAQVGQRHQALQLYQQLCQTLRRELEVEPAAETSALYQAIAAERGYPIPQASTALMLSKPRWPQPSPPHALVGREAQLTTLQNLLLQASTGQGRLVIMSGEQGVGKTRLAEEVIRQAQAAGVPVLYGAAYEQEGRLPYGPFVEAIRSTLTEQTGLHLREGLGQFRHDLARLLPELADPPLPEPAVGQERQRLFDAVVLALTLLAADKMRQPNSIKAGRLDEPEGWQSLTNPQSDKASVPTLPIPRTPGRGEARSPSGPPGDKVQPSSKQSTHLSTPGLLLFLDDLHAAGESSLQLLHYLARRLANLPLLVLCTVREEMAQRGTPIARLCRELSEQNLCRRLHLSTLNPTETARLCAELLAGPVAPEVAEAIAEISEGNPFFAQEIVLALVETRQIELRQGAWHFTRELAAYPAERAAGVNGRPWVIPDRVQQVIELRLERLSPAAYRLAGMAAVIGREFNYPLLQAVSQLPHTMLLDLLDEMVSAYLLEETGAGYRFRHGLIRQVLYEELTSHRRIWLHGQVAQALERLWAGQSNEQAAIFVYHYERAERYELAFRSLLRAGDQAQASYALREAVDYYDRAMQLSQQHAELAGAETMAGLLQRRAQTHLTLSDFEAAILDLEQLLENNRRTQDRRLEGEALYQVGLAHYWAHRLERAAAYLDQALRLAESLRYPELRAKALKLRAILSSTQGEVSPTAALEVVEAGEGGPSSPAEEHWGLAMLAHLRSDFESALQHGQACLKLGQSLGHTFLALGGYFVVGMSYASRGHYQAALDHLRQALDLSETAGDRFWRARLLNTLGWVYRELFDVEQAIRFDRASLEVAGAGTPRLTEAEGNALANLATDYLLQQDYAQARRYLEEGLRGSGEKPFMRWRYHTRLLILKGRLALAEGDPAAALAAAEEAMSITQGRQAPKNLARAHRLRGEALLAAGQVAEARQALQQALTVALELQSPALTWPCHLDLARLEESSGAVREEVQRHYLAAAEIFRQVADRLTEPGLRESFLGAPVVRGVLGAELARASREQV